MFYAGDNPFIKILISSVSLKLVGGKFESLNFRNMRSKNDNFSEYSSTAPSGLSLVIPIEWKLIWLHNTEALLISDYGKMIIIKRNMRSMDGSRGLNMIILSEKY